WEILESMKKEGMTVLVSTAYLDEGELCDELALMHRAVIITAASPNKMRGDFENLEEAMIARIQEVDKDIEHDTFRF
ncbi:MAG: ABC transporter ATP-binding protein, partial [Smithellaceae bacterium]|nr:ABC transporter ATP-binding protein [Smithellaceae bacterium]